MSSLIDAWRGTPGWRDRRDERPHFRTALVCLQNGHVLTGDLESDRGRARDFCDQCGSASVSACTTCSTPIRGRRHVPGMGATRTTAVAPYCHRCGNPYPWTATKLEAANTLADDLEDVSAADREALKRDLPELTKSGAQTDAAVVRIKRILGKATSEVGKALWRIAIDVASEAAKKSLLG